MASKAKQWRGFGIFLLVTLITTGVLFSLFLAQRNPFYFILLFLGIFALFGILGYILHKYQGKNKILRPLKEFVENILEFMGYGFAYLG